MPEPLIDTHAHLQWNKFDADRAEVIKRASDAGVSAILSLATDLTTSYQVVGLAEKFDNVFAAVGIHPTDVKNAGPADLDKIHRLSEHPKVVAIGETGMDFYWDETTAEIQKEFFSKQIELAVECDLPVVIHNRNAGQATLNILGSYQNQPVRGVFHCFDENADFARTVLDMGFYISFTGNITYKNSILPEVSQFVPIERLLLETDSPFLAPLPKRGRRNEPGFVHLIAEKHAEIRGISFDSIARTTTENARRLFRFQTTE